jgi:uncharacterized protein
LTLTDGYALNCSFQISFLKPDNLLAKPLCQRHILSHIFILLFTIPCDIVFMNKTHFEWDEDKDRENQVKHQVSFSLAQQAFLDPYRIIAEDVTHSGEEDRYYCIGRVEEGILTVRFTYRGRVLRIYGAGYWRQGRKIYEEQNKI